MSLGNTTEDEILSLIMTAVAMADIAENDASSPLTNLYISLHTGDPGEGGSQTTSEATYTGYARVAVARTTSGWTVTSGACTNDAEIAFGACTAGSNTITHVVIGKASSGTGQILVSGALSASLAVSAGITPRFAASALSFSLD